MKYFPFSDRDLSLFRKIARRQQELFSHMSPMLDSMNKAQKSIDRQLEPFHQVQESVHQQLEPLRQAQENIQKIILPVERAVRQFSRIQIRVPSSHSFPSRPNSELSVADTTTDFTIFPDDHHQDIGVTHHQFELENNHLNVENETLRSQISHLQNTHTEHRKKGGRKRHEKTNLIKNEIIQPIFCSSLIKGKTTRQIAFKIHDLFKKQDINNSENISNPQLEKISRLLNVDKKLISQTIEYCSKNQDTRNTLYRWCLTFNKNKTSQ